MGFPTNEQIAEMCAELNLDKDSMDRGQLVSMYSDWVKTKEAMPQQPTPVAPADDNFFPPVNEVPTPAPVEEVVQPQQQSNIEDEIARLRQELAQKDEMLRDKDAQIKQYRVQTEDIEDGEVPTPEDFENNKVCIVPPIPRGQGINGGRISTHEIEEKFNDINYQEVSFVEQGGMKSIPRDGKNFEYKGGYKVKGKGTKTITGIAKGPVSQPGQFFDVDKEDFPTLYDENGNETEFYVWADVRYVIGQPHGGKYLSDYQAEIKGNLKSVGNRLGIRKSFVVRIMDEIERQEQARAERGL